MTSWTWSAWVGVVGGLVVFALLFVPTVVWQSRRYGRLSGRRLLGTAAVAVYGVALVAYTLLPLPSAAGTGWCAEHAVAGPQLHPFQFLADIRRETAGLGPLATARSVAVLQVVFNVVLFLPWGVIARGFAGWGVLRSTASAALGSLLIEVTQTTGVFGLIGCAYRLGDVDDLMTNTLGGLLGALAAPLLLRWMPRPAELVAGRGLPRPVTALRRWLGMLIDAGAVLVLGAVLSVSWNMALVALGRPVGAADDPVPGILGSAVPAALLLWLPPLVGSGASLGQRAMWLEPRWPAEGGLRRGSLARRGLRGLCGAAGWGVLTTLGDLHLWEAGSSLAALGVVAAVLSVPWSRGHRGLSCALTGAVLVDARSAV